MTSGNNKIKNLVEILLPLLLTSAVTMPILGFVLLPTEFYYVVLALTFAYSFVQVRHISYRWVFFVSVLAFNCFISDAPPVFRVWERLFLFILILGVATPLLGSRIMLNIRYKTLKYLLIVFCTLGSISFFCYFVGINMMTKLRLYGEAHSINDAGWFSGITRHSMMLAPICAFATVYLSFLLISKSKSLSWKKLVEIIFLLITVVSAMLMAASRSAILACIFGVMALLFITFRQKIKRIIKIIFAVIIAIIALYPLLAPQFEKVLDKHHSSINTSGKAISTRQHLWNQRISEFKEEPIFGIGFCTVSLKDSTENTVRNGVIEPGSSWLGVLSMTGIVGMISILLIIIPTLMKLYFKSRNNDTQAALLFGLLIAIIIHMFAEGYIFSGGNPLCFYFWLLLGISYQISKEKTPFKERISTPQSDLTSIKK